MRLTEFERSHEMVGKRELGKDNVNVEPTARVIDDMAERMHKYADDLSRLAKIMRERKDLSCAAEATNTVCNCFLNLRLDLLVTRPLRELQR